MAYVTYMTVLPGYPGTKSLVDKFGDRLLCVRYKYNKDLKQKIKNAEIIIQEWNWEKDPKDIPQNKIVHVRIEFGEKQLGLLIRLAGGNLNKAKKYWELAYGTVRQLGLEDQIIQD